MCSFTVWTCSTSRRSLPDVLDDGKPRMSDIDEVKRLLARLNEDQLRRVQSHVRKMLPKHPLEERLMISADGMLDALDRAGDFTPDPAIGPQVWQSGSGGHDEARGAAIHYGFDQLIGASFAF